MLALLRRRDFGLLWSGGLISIAGDWILYSALPYFVYARTGSTVAAAAQSACAAFTNPAESALLPTLVGSEDLVAANALNALNNRIGRLAGLPLGGALLTYLGLRGVVV